jgi:hypothetical protein
MQIKGGSGSKARSMATALADRELASHVFAFCNRSSLLLTALGILQQR